MGERRRAVHMEFHRLRRLERQEWDMRSAGELPRVRKSLAHRSWIENTTAIVDMLEAGYRP